MLPAAPALQVFAFGLFLLGTLAVGQALCFLCRVRCEDLLERLFLSSCVGLTAICLGYFSCAFLVHEALSLFALATLALAVGWAWRRRAQERAEGNATSAATTASQPVSPQLWLLVLVAAVATISMVPTTRYLFQGGGGWIYGGHKDHLFHLANLHELARGVPPVESPHFSGMSSWPYHFFPDMWEMLLVRVAHLDPPFVHHVLAPLWLWALLALGVGLVVRSICSSTLAGAAGVVALFAHRTNEDEFLGYLSFNPPGLYGLVLVFALGLLLRKAAATERPSGCAALSGLIAAGLFYFKANYFLIVFPAWLAWFCHSSLRSSWTFRVAGALGAAAALLPLLAYHLTLEQARGVELDYGAFAGDFLCRAYGIPRDVVTAAPLLGPPLVVLAWTFKAGFTFPWLLTAAPALLVAMWRRTSWRPFHSALLVCVAVWLAVCLFVVERDSGSATAWNIAVHTKPLVVALMVPAAVWGACYLGEGRFSRVRGGTWVGALVVASLGTGLLCWRDNEARHLEQVELDSELVETLVVLRTAEPDSVVMCEPFEPMLVTGLAGRRAVLERPATFANYFPAEVDRRQTDIARFFQTTDPAEARTILERYHVTHVLERAGNPLHVQLGLEPCGGGERYRLYRRRR